jgi:signal transduction histidine kinase
MSPDEIDLEKKSPEKDSPNIEGGKKLIVQSNHRASRISHLASNDILSQTIATISHEISNPLLAISASAEMLLECGGNFSGDDVEKLREIIRAADRIQSVIEKLRDIETVHYRETAAGRMINIG